MEDTLRAITSTVTVANLGLNPCFNGRYSQSKMKDGKVDPASMS